MIDPNADLQWELNRASRRMAMDEQTRKDNGQFGSGSGGGSSGSSHPAHEIVNHYKDVLEKAGFGEHVKRALAGDPKDVHKIGQEISAEKYRQFNAGKKHDPKLDAAINALIGTRGASKKQLEEIKSTHGVGKKD